MNNTRTILFVVAALIVGLIAGFFLYTPVTNNINLNAGGVVRPVSKGIWTGYEYTQPWEWSSTEWSAFSTCLGLTSKAVVHNNLVQSCANSAIQKSPFAGGYTLQVSTVSRVNVALAVNVVISEKGVITGSTSDPTTYTCAPAAPPGSGVASPAYCIVNADPTANPTSSLSFPANSTISGYVNADGQMMLEIGKGSYVGMLYANGKNPKTNTKLYTGAVMDRFGLASIPGETLIPIAPYVSDNAAASSIAPNITIYPIDMWSNS